MGHHHHHHHHGMMRQMGSFGRKDQWAPPKGCMAIRVGGEGEEQQRFVVPLVYLNHPLFVSLLKEAEEEYGFEHKGAITIPCHVEHFRQVRDTIEKSRSGGASHHHQHHHHHHHNNHHHPFHLSCFGGLKA